ncbi:MAG: GNAT family N-acetyltransferase [Propionibacteriaceae bacterium]|nr:GNAT family N-acetyltransferase [Propionibacteriaceae bacterium]
MLEPYRMETLPLDAADDDPRWAAYLDLFANAFLESRPNEEALKLYRENQRADQATLCMVTAEGPGLDGRQGVAGFAWNDILVNCGRGPVSAMVIKTVAVRSTHRRKGLARAMMKHNLMLGRDRGHALAVLTVSEATIYGRFGFGIASRYESWEVDARRFALRPDVDVAPGSCELLSPDRIAEVFEQVSARCFEAHRGAHSPLNVHRVRAAGRTEEGEDRTLRHLVHYTPEGVPDGFVSFRHGGWADDFSDGPCPMKVSAIWAPSPAISRALWRGLVEIDLVAKVRYDSVPRGDSLPYSLVDSWAVNRRSTHDGVWLRILDLPSAVAQRGFDADGEVVVRVVDPMGLCDGTWRIRAEGDVATATLSADSPAVELGVDTLARLWHGDVTARELARAGIIRGDGVAALSDLFATLDPPVNHVYF